MATLLAVLETGSLSAASRRMGTPLATISRRMSDLEAHLGTRLLDRGTRRLTATEAGAAYALSARRILADVEEAERTAAGEYSAVKGELALSASPVIGRMHLTQVVTEFLDHYKDITVRMQLTDRHADLQADRIDCSLRIGFLRDSSLIARRVGVIRRVICASPAYLERRGRPVTLDDIANHDCITFTGLMRAEAWRFPEAGGVISVDVRSRLVTDEVDTVAEAALAGAGLACVLSHHIAPYVKSGKLALVLETFEPPPVPVSLLHLPGQIQAQKLRAFLDFATPRLKHRLEASEIARQTDAT